MNTTTALRHLVKTLHRMDLPDEQQRPSEAEYLLALASADAALFAETGETATGLDSSTLTLRDGRKVDVRAPWPLRPVGAGDGNTYVIPEAPVRVEPD